MKIGFLNNDINPIPSQDIHLVYLFYKYVINDIDKDIYWVVIEKFFCPIILFTKILICIAYIFCKRYAYSDVCCETICLDDRDNFHDKN